MKKILFALIGLYLLVYIVPLGQRPMVVPDETRYGEIAREIIASGDWVVPRLIELRYFDKPMLGYWLNAGSMLLFGESRFAIRFASALSVAVSAAALYLLVRGERDDKTALLASFILITFAEIHLIGTFSNLDSMVAAFITLSLCSFFTAQSTAGARQARWLLLTGLAAGCAFLIKGFLAIAIPVMVIGPFLLLQKRWMDIMIMPWLPLAGILLVSLPWSIAIAMREPDYWNYFFFTEHLDRFLGKGAAEHAQPFWYYIPVLLAGALPWTLVAPVPLFHALRRRWSEPLIRYCAIWFVLPFLFFSASSGKLGTYLLPCFPPLAILLAVGLTDVFEEGRERFFRVGARILAGILLLGFIGLAVSALLPMESAKLYASFERIKYAYILAAVLLAAVLAVAAVRYRSRGVRIACFGMAVAVGIAGFQFSMPVSRSVSVAMEAFLTRQKEHVPEDAVLLVDSRTFTAVSFIFGRSDVYLISVGEMGYGLSYEDSAHRFIGAGPENVLPFFKQHGARPIVVVARDNRIDDVLPELPEPVYRDEFRYLRFYVFEPLVE